MKKIFGFRGNQKKVVVADEPTIGLTRQQTEMIHEVARQTGMDPSNVLQEFVHIGFNRACAAAREQFMGMRIGPMLGLFQRPGAAAARPPMPPPEEKKPEEQVAEDAEERLRKLRETAGMVKEVAEEVKPS